MTKIVFYGNEVYEFDNGEKIIASWLIDHSGKEIVGSRWEAKK